MSRSIGFNLVQSRTQFPRFGFLAASSITAMIGPLSNVVYGQSEPATEKAAWDAFIHDAPPAEEAAYQSVGSPSLRLEIYQAGAATTRKPRPVLVLIHGGGWSSGTRDLLAPHARYFATLGWACVNLSYRLTSQPGVKIMDAAGDVRAAFDWVRTQAPQRGWDAKRISAFGESAGGQLACALGVLPPATTRWQAHSLVLVNPVLDLTALNWTLSIPGIREGGPIVAGTLAAHPAGAASPLFHLHADAPPILVLHGRKDVTVPVAQAESFAAAARNVGAKVELQIIEHAAHAFLLPEYGDPETIRATLQQIAQFLGRP